MSIILLLKQHYVCLCVCKYGTAGPFCLIFLNFVLARGRFLAKKNPDSASGSSRHPVNKFGRKHLVNKYFVGQYVSLKGVKPFQKHLKTWKSLHFLKYHFQFNLPLIDINVYATYVQIVHICFDEEKK